MSGSRRTSARGLDPIGPRGQHCSGRGSSRRGVRVYEHRACDVQGDVGDGASIDNSSVASIRASTDSRCACERSSAGITSRENAGHPRLAPSI